MQLKRLSALFLTGLVGSITPLTTQAQVAITAPNTPYSQSFNTLPTSGTATFAPNATLTGWYADRTGTGTSITANNGSSNAGGLYSYGAGTTEDRALGTVGSGGAAAGNFTYGWRLKNTTGATITALQITFTGEQWRNSAALAQTIAFSYLVSMGEITTTSPAAALPTGYVANTEGDFTSPIVGGTAGALDGNAIANRTTKTFTLSNLSIASGSEIMLRWYDPDHTGSDHGLAIDDVSVTATTDGGGIITPTLAAQPTALNGFSTINGTPSGPQTYTLTGQNLETNVTATAPTGYQLSSNGTDYASSLTLSPNAGSLSTVISVRLIGEAVGTYTGSIAHQYNATSLASVAVSGSVTDANQTTSIADARSRPNGTTIQSLPGGKIAGRVTASNQFGATVYIQDETSGIAVFSPTLSNAVQVGDQVQITGGTINSFSQSKQIDGAVTFINQGQQGALAPKAITVAELAAYEGQLISLSNAQIRPNTTVDAANPQFVLTPDANFLVNDVSGSAQLRINRFTNLPGQLTPGTATTVTGIVGRFNATLQLLPRSTADIPGTTPYAPAGGNIDRSATFDVATWNIEWLGNTTNGPSDENRQFTNAVQVLNGLQSDIIVLEEISSADAIEKLVANLPGYAGNCSPFVSNNPGHEIPANPATPSTIPGDAQRVCVLYRTEAVTLAGQKPLLEQVQSLPNYPASASNFWASGRYPYLWAFDVKEGSSTRRVNVIGIHAKANTAPLQTSYDRRKYDVQVLYDSLQAMYPNEALLLAGDFNDDLDRTVANVGTTESTYALFSNNTANYRSLTRSLSDNGFRTYLTQDNVIDHIVVSDELAPAYLEGSAGVGTPYLTLADYNNTTSDHIPVFARFDLSRLVPPLSVTATSASTPICPGSGVTVDLALAGGKAPYSYTITGTNTANTGNIATGTTTALTLNGLSTGVQTLTISVADAANRSASTTVAVTIEDKTAPVARAKNVSLTLNAQGQAMLTAEQVNDNSSDNCGPVSLSLSQTQFSCADRGEKTVTLTVTDASGNTATATATVTVGPVIAAPNYRTTAGQTTLTVPQYSGNVTFNADNCAGELSWTGSNGQSGKGSIIVPTTATGTVTYTGLCTVGVCPGPTSTVTVTVVAEPLKILEPTLDCTTGQLTLRTTGGNGNPIEYQIGSVTKGWGQKAVYTLDAKDRSRDLTIKARQRRANTQDWTEIEVIYKSTCRSSARVGVPETSEQLRVQVLGNPITNGVVTVEVHGAAGGPLQLSLVDLNGRPVGVQRIEQATTTERASWSVADQPAGVLLLRVSTLTQQQVIRLLKP